MNVSSISANGMEPDSSLSTDAERLESEFYLLEKQYACIWRNPSNPALAIPKEIWSLIFDKLPVAAFPSLSLTCKHFDNIIKTDWTLKAKICRHRTELQRMYWQELWGKKNRGRTRRSLIISAQAYAPLQMPQPDFDNKEMVEEHLPLLDRSYRIIKRTREDKCLIDYVYVPLIIATCGCGGIFCLVCGLIMLKNKITHGHCAIDPEDPDDLCS